MRFDVVSPLYAPAFATLIGSATGFKILSEHRDLPPVPKCINQTRLLGSSTTSRTTPRGTVMMVRLSRNDGIAIMASSEPEKCYA